MKDLKKLKVLYVEDDDATREAFAKFIKPRVGSLLVASSGEEGAAKYIEYKPDILIVDLILSGMSGLEMIGQIRKENKECRILITSTISELDTVLAAVDHGIDHYIVKPIDTDELERKLEGMAEAILTEQKEIREPFLFEGTGKVGLMEEAIRRDFLKIMKTHMGKGPQDVKIMLYENKVEIIAVDAVTTMEKTIGANLRNLSIVEQFRKVFYEEIASKLEESVTLATRRQCTLTGTQVDGGQRIDRILLTIV